MRIQTWLLFALALPACLAPLRAEEPPTSELSRAVGSVYGKTITAADIGLTAPIDTTLKFDSRHAELWGLMGRITKAFGKPISDRFVEEHKHKIDATEGEIAAFKKTSQEQRQKNLRETEDRLEKVKAQLAASNLSEETRIQMKKSKRCSTAYYLCCAMPPRPESQRKWRRCLSPPGRPSSSCARNMAGE